MATTAPTGSHAITAHFYVRSVDASVQFYVNTLGFDIVRQQDDHAVVALGSSVVQLTDARSRGRKGRLARPSREALIVPDIEGMYRRVRDARVAVIDEMRDSASQVRNFVTVDPDGFPIRLAAV